MTGCGGAPGATESDAAHSVSRLPLPPPLPTTHAAIVWQPLSARCIAVGASQNRHCSSQIFVTRIYRFLIELHRVFPVSAYFGRFFFIFRFSEHNFFYAGKTSTYCCCILCMYITVYNRTI